MAPLECREAAKNHLNVRSSTASPLLSGFTPRPGFNRSAVQPFELRSAEAERIIKSSHSLRTQREQAYVLKE